MARRLLWLPCMDEQAKANEQPALTDKNELRARARQEVSQGAVTQSYGADPHVVCEMLNEALATELLCSLRYKRHYFMASGLASEAVKEEFLEHAKQETEHADRIAERIVQLGGEPDFNPVNIAGRSHAEYVEGNSLREMIYEDLVAERVAIQSYSEMLEFLHEKDPVTYDLVRKILATEQEHAEDMVSLLQGLPAADGH
jgi:bacterioferritin